MRKKSKVAYRNRNHTGWWIFCEVDQWVSDRQGSLTSSSRCPVWENTRLIRANGREKAYRKALKLGRAGHPSRTKAGEWGSLAFRCSYLFTRRLKTEPRFCGLSADRCP